MVSTSSERPAHVAVQQRGHRGQALTGSQCRHGALPPQGGDHLAVRRVRAGPVVGVAGVAHGGDLAQDAEPALGQHRVTAHCVVHPVVDGRCDTHEGRGHTAQEPHVLDRQRGLHVAAVGAVEVEERPDRLLGLEAVPAGAERHQVAPGQVGGEGDPQPVLDLPGVGGEVQVLGRNEAEPAQPVGEPVELVRADLLGVQRLLVQSGAEGEVGVLAPHGHPLQPDRPPGLRGVAVVVVDPEADAAVVGDEGGMSLGHRRLDGLEVRVHQVGRRPLRVVVLVHGRGQRAADLLEVGAEELVRHAEDLLQLGHQVEGVRVGRYARDRALDRTGIDRPVLEREPLGVEPIAGFADVEPVGACVLLRHHQPLVSELRERLGDQVALGRGQMVRPQVVEAGRDLGSQAGPGEVGAGAERQRSLLVGEPDNAVDHEAGRVVQARDRVVADVGLHHDPVDAAVHAGDCGGEQEGHDRPHHLGREAVDGSLRRRHEQVHPHVVGLDRVVGGELALRRLVGLDEERRRAVDPTPPHAMVRGGDQGGVLAPHPVEVGVEQPPEVGPGMGHPAVQDLGVAIEVERLQGQPAHRAGL